MFMLNKWNKINHVTNQNYYVSTTTVPMATKIDWMVTYFERLPFINIVKPWSSGVTSSRYKLKLSYLHYHSAYGQKTWHDGDWP